MSNVNTINSVSQGYRFSGQKETPDKYSSSLAYTPEQDATKQKKPVLKVRRDDPYDSEDDFPMMDSNRGLIQTPSSQNNIFTSKKRVHNFEGGSR